MATEQHARVRWDERWANNHGLQQPSSFVVESAEFLPQSGVALDLAGGTGRHSVWLARRGLRVTLVDVSPVALARAGEAATEMGVEISTIERDLEVSGLPDGNWDVVLIHHFLARDLLPLVTEVLVPGGVFVFCQPTRRNLERHDRPGQAYLLEEGELAAIIGSTTLEPLILEESWGADGRHEARLVARRTPG